MHPNPHFNPVQQKLLGILGIVGRHKQWTQGYWARGSTLPAWHGGEYNGRNVLPNDDGAVCWCMAGALAKIEGSDRACERERLEFHDVTGPLQHAIKDLHPWVPDEVRWWNWNDLTDTTHMMVVRVLLRAVAIAGTDRAWAGFPEAVLPNQVLAPSFTYEPATICGWNTTVTFHIGESAQCPVALPA